MTRHATIAGVGSSLPPKLVPNTWFESQVETDDAWIRDRTGIEARHFAADDVQTSDLAIEASRAALDAAGVAPEQLDMIIVATITGDTVFPATAVWVQQKLGVSCPAFDINAACSGFSYGLSAAIITGDPERGMALADRIQSGIVHVNDSTVHDEPHAPFGGIKSSGLGRHGGRAAIEAFTETRWVSLQTERRHYPFDR